MDLIQKLEILADAAKYDVACTSSGVDRSAQRGALGATSSAGCCHSFTADGRCISLLKVLQTNVCIYDCAYCVNRRSNEVPRASFTSRELADLTIEFYRRNYIEGLFLSSGVVGSPDKTTEIMTETLRILREEYRFGGYIHAKVVPGTAFELVDKIGRFADRLSVNMELPSQSGLELLAPEKNPIEISRPMLQIRDTLADEKETKALALRRSVSYPALRKNTRRSRPFAPAGQSTQMIIGATPENDYDILGVTGRLYREMSLKRVFYSAFVPVVEDARLPQSGAVQLDREHRLYQADWLLRFYGFDVDEIIDADHPYLDLLVDPKANWALNHLDLFPVEVNTAPIEMLLRVPGIGVKGAKMIRAARRERALGENELKRIGIAYTRARFFVTCNGRYLGKGTEYTRESIRAQLAAPIDGGRHGRRSARVSEGQLSLF